MESLTNLTFFFLVPLALIKPLSTTGVLSKVHLHTSSINWDEFYANHVPKSHMPRNYGGDLESIRELHEKNRVKLIKFKEYFNYEEKQANRQFDEYADEMKKNCS